ncbi:HU family DNA-binding protein [Palleronia abyssalis]|uniref:DNA-binding protein HU n=1 Tax=Palleronia abyssalis TaxID=1501240 RepID=A0A2R8BRX3_9RHOB|nr:HU family DNA-binding protein [Palleronia abyssalis]SPJ22924.1 DNA-binding protein HU [Palleronia abyssalis]
MTENPELKVVEETLATVTKEVKKPELIDRVVAVSGMKKKDVKPVVEAMLTVLGQSLTEEEQLNLQPFGRVRVVKKKDLANGQALTLKLRRSGPSLGETAEALPSEGLAEGDEDS